MKRPSINLAMDTINATIAAAELARMEAATAERPDVAALLTRAHATLQAAKVTLLRKHDGVSKGGVT